MRAFLIRATAFLTLLLPLAASADERRDTVMQYSTIDALLAGVFDGAMSFSEVKNYGDFGIGTFNELDGEMIGFDGKFYQIRSDGKAYPVSLTTRSPFLTVTFFTPDYTIHPTSGMKMSEVLTQIQRTFPSKNDIYAIKITGSFKTLKARAVPKQQRPYKTLYEASKQQSEFNLSRSNGTVVGFWLPVFYKGINVPEFHLHYLNDQRNAGGHVLDFTADNITVAIDMKKNFTIKIPDTTDFHQSNLSQNRDKELEAVERGAKHAK